MKPITIFTWGYYGWGNHTRQLVESVDTVETSRGFKPPMFVDIRIRRAVRAAGFTGPAFENLLGPNRHRWMKSLGKCSSKLEPVRIRKSPILRRLTSFSTLPLNWPGTGSGLFSSVAASGPDGVGKTLAIEVPSRAWC